MEIQLYTADFPWFFVILGVFYFIKYITTEKEKSVTNKVPKKVKRPVTPTSVDSRRKQDVPKTVFKQNTSSVEKHKPKMSDEMHGNPMHQEVYRSKDVFQYDYATVDTADDSLEKNSETLTEAMNKGKYTSQDNFNPRVAAKVKLNKKEYSPKELIILQTILDRKY